MAVVAAKKDDDYMTPKEVWNLVIDYIPKDKVIWEAFYGDGKSGEYLKELGCNVIHENIDFFTNNKGDVVVSNPPFSNKNAVLKRLKELEKPFMLILPANTLGTKGLYNLFKNELQVIVPNGRINFIKKGELTNGVWFPCFFFCWKMNLPKDLLFV
jgi:hypothetical protein